MLKSKKPEERQLGQLLISLEYENLVTALHLALTARVSFQHPYFALADYLDMTQEYQRGLALGQSVLQRLETLSLETLTSTLSSELIRLIDDIAYKQLYLKQYGEAEQSYQKALAFLRKNENLDAAAINKRSATFYHQLGMVAQEQRQFEQAEQYYQQALQIDVGVNDRYAQADTYHQLGMVAQEQGQFEQAEQYYQQALQIFVEYKNTHSREVTLRNLARLWKESNNEQLPAAVAQILRVSVADVVSMWQDVSESHDSEKNNDDEKAER